MTRGRALRWTSRGVVVVAILSATDIARCGAQARPAIGAWRPTLVASRPVVVSGALPNVHHNETVVAAHPRQPGLLLACSMLGLEDGRRAQVVAYRSSDGGRSWQLAVRSDEYFAGDPSCAYAGDGTAYVATKTNHTEPTGPWASDTDSLTIRSSSDGGVTWSRPVRPLQANDRPWIVPGADTGGGATLYATFDGHRHLRNVAHAEPDFVHRLVLATLAERGARPVAIASFDLPLQSAAEQRASLACGIITIGDGTVMVLQHEMRLGGANAATGKLRELGGRLAVFSLRPDGRGLDTASALGETVSGYNDPGTRGVPCSIAAGRGSLAGALLVAWSDFSGPRGTVRVGVSRDRGRTWSKSTLPAGGPLSHGFMPTLAVSSSGVVGALWYERPTKSSGDEYEPRFTASADGGSRWLAAVTLDATSSAQQPASVAATGRVLPNGGDTAGLVADAAGVFHAVWVGRRAGVQQVLSSRITVR